jgi:putative membrane protein
MMGFWFIIPVFVIAAVGYFIVRLFQGEPTMFRNSGSNQTPIEILEKRYARGEINKQEFVQMRDDLS